MIRIIICLLAGVFVLSPPGFAQFSNEQVSHLNKYVAYINESTHILKEVRRTLETFNLHLNHAYGRETKKNYARQFVIENLEDNQRYFVDHLCTRIVEAKNPLDNLEHIYQKIKQNQALLSPAVNDSLMESLDLLRKTIEAVVNESNNLAAHTEGKAYLTEAHFQSSYERLVRFEKLYEEYFVQKTQLHQRLRLIYQAYPVELQELINAYDLNREILHAIRRDDSTQVVRLLALHQTQRKKIRDLDEEFLQNKSQYTYHNTETFSFLNKHLSKTEALVQAYIEHKIPVIEPLVADVFPYELSGNACYYYNEILGKHDEHYVGYTFFLNRSLIHKEHQLLKFPDEPYWFEAIFPAEHPLVSQPYLHPLQPAAKLNTPMAGAPPSNLIFLLDVSGSMQRYNKMPLLKKSFIELLGLLRPEDQIGIVTYSGEAKVELAATSAGHRGKILLTIESLKGSGKTNAARGLKLAYHQAENSFIPNGTNRIILATDGDLEKAYSMKKLINEYVDKGITLSVFYFPSTSDHPSTKIRLSRFAEHAAGNFRKIHQKNIDQILLEEAKGLIIERVED